MRKSDQIEKRKRARQSGIQYLKGNKHKERLKPIEIGSPLQLPKTIKVNFMKIFEMTPLDFKNFDSISSAFNFSLIAFSKCRSIMYQSNAMMTVSSFGQTEFVHQPIIKFSQSKRGVTELPSQVPKEKKKRKLASNKIECIKKMIKNIKP